jgi:hypothetical protein
MPLEIADSDGSEHLDIDMDEEESGFDSALDSDAEMEDLRASLTKLQFSPSILNHVPRDVARKIVQDARDLNDPRLAPARSRAFVAAPANEVEVSLCS